jgi:peptide deformylase
LDCRGQKYKKTVGISLPFTLSEGFCFARKTAIVIYKMTKTAIVQKGEPVLRQVAEEVPLAEIGSPRIQKMLHSMQQTLEKEEDGVALAAPQIGVSLRIFVVSPRVFTATEEGDVVENPKRIDVDQPLVYINPTIVKMSRKKIWLDEGCLSVRWLYGKVSRAERVMVSAFDAEGKPFTRGAGGILAQIFQHEIDHLDGVLFVDKAEDIQDLPPEKQQAVRSQKKHGKE